MYSFDTGNACWKAYQCNQHIFSLLWLSPTFSQKMCYVLLEGDMSYVTYATCDLAILQKPGLTSRIPLQCNHTEVTSKNGLLHMTMKYISRCKKYVISEAFLQRKLKLLFPDVPAQNKFILQLRYYYIKIPYIG